MNYLEVFSFAQVHMHTAWQTWVKAAHGAHDVDALELIRAILLEDGRVLHGIFIRSGGAIDVAHAAVPGSGRIGMVVSDLAALDDHVVRKRPAHGLVETATDGIPWYREVVPCPGVAGWNPSQRLVHKVQRDSRSIGLEVGAGAVALDGIAPLRNLPLELYRRLRGGFGQGDLDTVASCLDQARQMYNTGQSGCPQASDGAATSVVPLDR